MPIFLPVAGSHAELRITLSDAQDEQTMTTKLVTSEYTEQMNFFVRPLNSNPPSGTDYVASMVSFSCLS